MAVYFDHKLQDAPMGHHTLMEWHKSHPILALASDTQKAKGCLTFYKEDGEKLNNAGIERTFPITATAWHPIKKVLAVGWDNGTITIYSLEEKYQIINENSPIHSTTINFLTWSSGGSKLVSGDAVGEVCVWKADSRGRLQHNPMRKKQLPEPISHCLLRPSVSIDGANIAALARAAVSGDEKALDMFNWKPKAKLASKTNPTLLGTGEATTFFIGGDQGGVYFINEEGECEQVFITEGGVRKLMFYEDRSLLITITTNSMLLQHTVDAEGKCREVIKVKLSGKSDDPDFTWAGSGILATATGESVIRMWDMEHEENFVLSLDGNQAFEPGEKIFCVAFCDSKGILAAGTGSGHIALFKHKPLHTSTSMNRVDPETCWHHQSPCSLSGYITKIVWGSSKMLLAANLVESVYIMNEQILQAHCNQQTAAVQSGPMKLSVEFFGTDQYQDLNTDIQITGIFTTKENIAIWNGKKLVIYEISTDSNISAAGTFSTDTPIACLFEQNVYTIETGKIQVRTFQGTVKQLLHFTESEGDPTCIEVCNCYLVAASAIGTIKIYDLSRREAKQMVSKNISDMIVNFGCIQSAKCNSNASQISIIVNRATGALADSKIYVYDVELDKLTYFNFETGKYESEDNQDEERHEIDDEISAVERGRKEAARDIQGRFPISHHWDNNEPRLLVCEAKISGSIERKQPETTRGITLSKTVSSEIEEIMVVSLFVTQDHGVIIQDSFPLSNEYESMFGVDVPYFYFIKKKSDSRPASRKVMRDFVGLENSDKLARDAMMNFSFYLTLGNMDEAFKAIKLIKSGTVWENMAKMCVKTRRLDVAAVCLGNMNHARGARMLRRSGGLSTELDAKVAMLASQLGLSDEAERLLKNSKRFDLLNEMYQANGQWNKAIETAEKYDRMHARSTYFNYAKHLEAKENIDAAISNYERSDTHRFQVPRMLFDDPRQLEAYIMKRKDRSLRKWWAQYMESTGEMQTALEFYEAAGDVLSLVRVSCYCGDLKKAAEICQQTGDKAACFHLGRQYEMNDEIKEAIHWFGRARAFGNAIRLCREAGMEDQLMNLALMAKPHDQIEAARYYEQQPNGAEKAVMLYHKAGHVTKALDLAFNTKQFAALHMISEQLDDCNDPQVLQRCADFFLENGQYDRAVDLLASAKKYWDAIKLCLEQHVPVNEELVERLTPPKPDSPNNEWSKLLEAVADICMQQRLYHIATKKFTQAGNRVKAMKALLKSGDTEKIVFFANVSKQKDIYIMAANYLQSLDWSRDAEIMKNIISFYTKGRALDSLASFYDACAQVEMDEYQNYDKALGALTESYKCLAKASEKNGEIFEDRISDIKQRLTIVKKFVMAKKSYEEDADNAIKSCQSILEEARVDQALRIGDIFAFMVEHFTKREKWKAAYSCIEEFLSRERKAKLTFYIQPKLLEMICKAVGKPVPRTDANKTGQTNESIDDDEEIADEVEEEPSFL